MRILLFPLRFIVFVIGWLAWLMEVSADWLVGARARTEYVRVGACKRCGRCCRLLALVLPRGVSKRDWLVRIFGLWHRLAMNFHPAGEEDGWLLYRCGYYAEGAGVDPGHCSIYPFRHRLCRFFPRQGLFGHPSLHKDCGFAFVRRDVLERRRFARMRGEAVFKDILDKKGDEYERRHFE